MLISPSMFKSYQHFICNFISNIYFYISPQMF
eukprot:UN06266